MFWTVTADMVFKWSGWKMHFDRECCCCQFNDNILKPTGYWMYHRFNIDIFCTLPAHCICVLCMDFRTKSANW